MKCDKFKTRMTTLSSSSESESEDEETTTKTRQSGTIASFYDTWGMCATTTWTRNSYKRHCI